MDRRTVGTKQSQCKPSTKLITNSIDNKDERKDIVDSDVGMDNMIDDDVVNVDESKIDATAIVVDRFEKTNQRHLSMDNKIFNRWSQNSDKSTGEHLRSNLERNPDNWSQNRIDVRKQNTGDIVTNKVEVNESKKAKIDLDTSKIIKRNKVKLSPKSKSDLMVKLRKTRWSRGKSITPSKRIASKANSDNDEDEGESEDNDLVNVTQNKLKSKVSQLIANFEENIRVEATDSNINNDAKPENMKLKVENAFTRMMSKGGGGHLPQRSDHQEKG